MNEVTLKQLLEAGCHFGHKSDRWHPKAADFIYQTRDGIHIIDLVKTKAGLDKAVEFIRVTAKSGGTVLFIGTKRQAAAVIKEQASAAGAPYISQRWIGGFLTNWEQVHKNLEKIRRLQDEQEKNAWKKYPKHERMKLARYLARLNYFYGGVVNLMQPPTAIMVVDIKREVVAVREAKKMNVPVVGIVDTNSDPTPITIAIPANDDAVGSVRLLVETLTLAYKEGRQIFEKQKIKDETKEKREQEKKVVTAKATEIIKEVRKEEIKKEPEVKAEKEKESEKRQAESVKEGTKQNEKAVEKLKAASVESSGEPKEEKPKKKRGRPKKSDTAVSSRAES